MQIYIGIHFKAHFQFVIYVSFPFGVVIIFNTHGINFI